MPTMHEGGGSARSVEEELARLRRVAVQVYEAVHGGSTFATKDAIVDGADLLPGLVTLLDRERHQLRETAKATAIDARVLLDALDRQSYGTAGTLAERIYSRHARWDVGEGPHDRSDTGHDTEENDGSS